MCIRFPVEMSKGS